MYVKSYRKIQLDPFEDVASNTPNFYPSTVFLQYPDEKDPVYQEVVGLFKKELIDRKVATIVAYEYAPMLSLYQTKGVLTVVHPKIRIPFPAGNAFLNIDPRISITSVPINIMRSMALNNPKLPILYLFMNPSVTVPEQNQLLYQGIFEHPLVSRLRYDIVTTVGMNVYTVPSIASVATFLPSDWETQRVQRYASPTYTKDAYQGIVLIPKGSFNDIFICKFSYNNRIPSSQDERAQQDQWCSDFMSALRDFKNTAMTALPTEYDLFKGTDPTNPESKRIFIVENGEKIPLREAQENTLYEIQYIFGKEAGTPFLLDPEFSKNLPLSSNVDGYYPKCPLEDGSIYVEAVPYGVDDVLPAGHIPFVDKQTFLTYHTSSNVWMMENGQKRKITYSNSNVLLSKIDDFIITTATKLRPCKEGTAFPTCKSFDKKWLKCGDIDKYRYIENEYAYMGDTLDKKVNAYTPITYVPSCKIIDTICAPQVYIPTYSSNVGKPPSKTIQGRMQRIKSIL